MRILHDNDVGNDEDDSNDGSGSVDDNNEKTMTLVGRLLSHHSCACHILRHFLRIFCVCVCVGAVCFCQWVLPGASYQRSNQTCVCGMLRIFRSEESYYGRPSANLTASRSSPHTSQSSRGMMALRIICCVKSAGAYDVLCENCFCHIKVLPDAQTSPATVSHLCCVRRLNCLCICGSTRCVSECVHSPVTSVQSARAYVLAARLVESAFAIRW